MKRDEAKDWIKFAFKDLKVAKASADIGEFELALYHLQQCVEKSLKALIVFYDIGVNIQKFRTHNIENLLEILVGARIDLPDYAIKSKKLTIYAFTTRYPDFFMTSSRKEYEETYEMALKVYKWAKGIIEGSALE